MNNLWLNKLRKKMEGHEEKAPEGLLDDILNVVEKSNNAIFAKKNKREVWRNRIITIAAAAAIIFEIGYFNFNTQDTSLDTAIPIASVESAELSNENISTPTSKPTKVYPAKVITHRSERHREAVADTITPNIASKKPAEPSTKRIPLIEQLSEKESYNEPQIAIHKESTRKFAMNLFASNLTGSSNTHSGIGKFISRSSILDITPELALLRANNQEEIKTTIKHRLPIRAGLSISYYLLPRLSIETGLIYSNLSSDLSSGNKYSSFSGIQTLHYLGIPLNMNYTLWENNRFKVYAAAGGMIEKNISGQLRTDYIVDNQVESSATESVNIKGVQFSMKASAGMQLNISQVVGIYAEPGVSYYFDNGSNVETIYKDKPLNFNLNLGLRVSLGK